MGGYKSKTSGIIKRSVSFSPLINKWAEQIAKKRGYTNFSQFLASLIRQAKDDDEKSQKFTR
jgi:hypothetical protein